MRKLWTILLLVLCLLVAVSFAASGCGGGDADDSLVDVWTDEEGVIEYEFKSDGTMVLRFMGQEEAIPYTAENGKLTVEDAETGEPIEAEYSIDGDTLTITGDGEEEILIRKSSAAESSADTTASDSEGGEDFVESDATDSGSGPGTREDPIPLGQEAQVGDWTVMVASADLDATSILVSEDEFNDPPQDGNQYVLVTLDATYTGSESSTFWVDVSTKFVGGKGNTFGAPEGFAMPANPMWNVEEAFTGASISGDTVFEVSSDQVEGGVLLLEPSFSVDDIRVFFALE